MESTQQPPSFYVGHGQFADGTPGVAFMVSPSSFIETTTDPVPGVLLTPAQAREAAYALLLFAEQLAGRLVKLPAGTKPTLPGS